MNAAMRSRPGRSEGRERSMLLEMNRASPWLHPAQLLRPLRHSWPSLSVFPLFPTLKFLGSVLLVVGLLLWSAFFESAFSWQQSNRPMWDVKTSRRQAQTFLLLRALMSFSPRYLPRYAHSNIPTHHTSNGTALARQYFWLYI